MNAAELLFSHGITRKYTDRNRVSCENNQSEARLMQIACLTPCFPFR